MTTDELLDRVVRRAQADDRISAVLVYGSHASGKADAHSDVDIGLVVTDADYDAVLAERDALIRSLGEPLFAEDFGDPSNGHVIYADGTACEFIIKREGELDLGRPYRAILDKTGVIGRVLARPAPAKPEPDAETVRWLLAVFWHDFEHVTVALARGQALWAHGALEELRGICLQLARLSAGADQEPDDPYWKVDGVLPAAVAERLRATVVPPELEPMREAARALLSLYRELGAELAVWHGIEYPAELDRLLSVRLDEA